MALYSGILIYSLELCNIPRHTHDMVYEDFSLSRPLGGAAVRRYARVAGFLVDMGNWGELY